MIENILTQSNCLAAIGSFIAGYLKCGQINNHEIMKMHVKGQYDMQKEARKDKSLSSILGRFLLVGTILSMIFYIIIITLAKNIPLTIETVEPTGWIGHIFEGPSKEVFTTIRGAVIPSWMPTILIGAMGFWFGIQRG